MTIMRQMKRSDRAVKSERGRNRTDRKASRQRQVFARHSGSFARRVRRAPGAIATLRREPRRLPRRNRDPQYQRLQRQALRVERQTIIRLRNERVINDDALRRIQRDLDLAEARLTGS